MDKRIYDRKNKRLYTEKEFMGGEIGFLYRTVPGRLLLDAVITRRWFSWLYTRQYHSRKSAKRIPGFVKDYEIDMHDVEQKEYTSFNDFFTRRLRPGKRPVNMENSVLISPADAKLQAFTIGEGAALRIKGGRYTIASLLEDSARANAYRNGTCLVFRLSVDDYHRYCYIDGGEIVAAKEINGRLHTVRAVAVGKHQVYRRNHRIVTRLHTANFGEVLAIEVGALLVGRIHNHPARAFHRGQEKGYFAYGGSTIILLFKADTVKMDKDIAGCSKRGMETKVRMGETIGRAMHARE